MDARGELTARATTPDFYLHACNVQSHLAQIVARGNHHAELTVSVSAQVRKVPMYGNPTVFFKIEFLSGDSSIA